MKKAVLFFIGFISIFRITGKYLHHELTLSASDRAYVDSFMHEWKINANEAYIHANFTNELEFIKKVDSNVVGTIGHQLIDLTKFGDVAYYFKNRKGFCYDRSSLIEKICLAYHFQFRHVFVYFNNDGSACTLKDFFKKETASHAITEIKTSKGWMIVGSNSAWVGVDEDGNPFNVSHLSLKSQQRKLPSQLTQANVSERFYEKHPDFKYVYGVYSRNGSFFSPHRHFPEVNFSMFLANISPEFN